MTPRAAKDLKCHYRVFSNLVQGDSSLENILQKVVDLIPSGWQFSSITSARINIEGRLYILQTRGYLFTSDHR
jgi:hypothetical protein